MTYSTPEPLAARLSSPRLAPGPSAGATAKSLREGRNLLTMFVCVIVLSELGLFFLGNTPLRMPLRLGMYLVSLGYLFMVKGRNPAKTFSRYFTAIGVILGIAVLNPDRGSWIAGIAQGTLYLSVLAPLMWGAKCAIDRTTLVRVIWILWGFYTLSAVFGILQVKYPGQFQGAISNNLDERFVSAMSYRGADGQLMMRPKGLTDAPGGAGGSGVYSIIFGLGALLTTRRWLVRAAIVGTMVISLMCVFLSHGRTNLVIVAIAVLITLFVLFRRRSYAQCFLLLNLLAGVTLIGTPIAFSIGGEETLKRWETLLEDDPRTVAYDNRGVFLDRLVQDDVWEYPVGAGSGRWGMMNVYFGDPGTDLWAEMMWQALLYDGGLPLIIAYIMLLVALLRNSYRIAVLTPDPVVGTWAAVTTAFTAATIAASFAFPIYIKAPGMQLMLLHVCLFAIHRAQVLQRSRAATAVAVDSPGFSPARAS